MSSLAPMPSVKSLRQAVVETGRRLYDRGLVVAAEGNLSARLADGTVLITPAGICKGRMSPEDLVVVDADGRPQEGEREPSSELSMHLTALRVRPDVNACVHAHPPYATAFAVAGIALTESVLPEVITTLGSIPLADYATPSTAAVGAAVAPHLAGSDAVLLRNHGVLTVGADLEDAFRKMETVERFAQVTHLARSLGSVGELTANQVEELRELARMRSARSPVRKRRPEGRIG